MAALHGWAEAQSDIFATLCNDRINDYSFIDGGIFESANQAAFAPVASLEQDLNDVNDLIDCLFEILPTVGTVMRLSELEVEKIEKGNITQSIGSLVSETPGERFIHQDNLHKTPFFPQDTKVKLENTSAEAWSSGPGSSPSVDDTLTQSDVQTTAATSLNDMTIAEEKAPGHDSDAILRTAENDNPSQYSHAFNKSKSNVENELTDRMLQKTWEKEMTTRWMQSRSQYETVAVLLLSWHEECDDLGTKAEVDSLASVFRDVFNYKVQHRTLGGSHKRIPQVQINAFLASFIYEFDGFDGQDGLLIVYYAGHGSPGSKLGHLELSPSHDPLLATPEKLNQVIWNSTESLIHHTSSDVFIILDCCYAGDVTRGNGNRKFECLAASSPGCTTLAPGPGSFTSALIWSLKEIKKRTDSFTTTELVHFLVKEAPDFPSQQRPVLHERSTRSGADMRIVLRPLTSSETCGVLPLGAKTAKQTTESKCLLDLQFTLERYPDTDQVRRLAESINQMVHTNPLNVERVSWKGLSWPK